MSAAAGPRVGAGARRFNEQLKTDAAMEPPVAIRSRTHGPSKEIGSGLCSLASACERRRRC